MWSLSLTASTQACASASAGNAMAPMKFALQCTQIGAKEYIKMHVNYSEEIQMHHSNTSKYISNCSLGISDQWVLEQNANNSFQGDPSLLLTLIFSDFPTVRASQGEAQRLCGTTS